MKSRWLVPLLMLVLLLISVAPVFAQEATPEATAIPGSDVTIINEPAASPAETSSLVLLLLGGLVGAIATGAPLLYVITHMTTQQKDMAERLYLSTPESFQESFRSVLTLLEKAISIGGQVTAVLDEVTDGQPNTDTSSAPLSPQAERDMEHG